MTTATKIREIGSLIGKRKKLLGALGESLVAKHLRNKGFNHLESNYQKRVGEIDLVLQSEGKIHFLEVKTVSREKFAGVIHETRKHAPEENVSKAKLRKISKTVQLYLKEKASPDTEWQFDVATVYLDLANKKAHIKFIKDVPLPA
jgi:putative endonuclease